MTTTTAIIHESVLKNVRPDMITTGMAIMNVLVAEAERRDHLAGKILSAQYDRERGIGLLVKDEGDMKHLVNAIGTNSRGRLANWKVGRQVVGQGRKGTWGGFDVTVWYETV